MPIIKTGSEGEKKNRLAKVLVPLKPLQMILGWVKVVQRFEQ